MQKQNNKDRSREKFNEDEIQKKLYGSATPKNSNTFVTEKETPALKPEEQITNHKEIQKEILNEIDGLKNEINILEKQLERSQRQKDRLVRKLAQKRILDKMVREFFDFSEKTAGKITLLLIILSLAIFSVVFLNSKNKTPPASGKLTQPVKLPRPAAEPPLTRQMPEPIKEEPQKKILPGKIVYTIQVAEYANESAANEFVKLLEEQGFSVKMETLYRNNNRQKPYFKINVGEFNTFDEAKKHREVFQKKTNINDTFIKIKQ